MKCNKSHCNTSKNCNNNQNKMKAELTLKTAKEMYKQGGTAKMFALDNYTEEQLTKKELPSSWEELNSVEGYYIKSNSDIICSRGLTFCDNKNIFPTRELAEASLALAQLLQLRDRYNDGWVADWNDRNKKYIINIFLGKIDIDYYHNIQSVLNFKTRELRDLFLENFRDLIETAKPLL